MDAAAIEILGAVMHVPVLAARNGLARPLVLARDSGTAPGMHVRRIQTLQLVHPQCG